MCSLLSQTGCDRDHIDGQVLSVNPSQRLSSIMVSCDGCANTALLKLQRAAEPGGSPQRQGLGPVPRDADSAGLGGV